MVSSCWI